MGFWDSVKAGFYRSAGIDDDSMKDNEELRGLRSDLAAPPDAQHDEIRAYMQFVNGTLGSLEPALCRRCRWHFKGTTQTVWPGTRGWSALPHRPHDAKRASGSNARGHTPPAARQRGVDVVRLPGRRVDQISWRAHRECRTLPDHGNRSAGTRRSATPFVSATNWRWPLTVTGERARLSDHRHPRSRRGQRGGLFRRVSRRQRRPLGRWAARGGMGRHGWILTFDALPTRHDVWAGFSGARLVAAYASLLAPICEVDHRVQLILARPGDPLGCVASTGCRRLAVQVHRPVPGS